MGRHLVKNWKILLEFTAHTPLLVSTSAVRLEDVLDVCTTKINYNTIQNEQKLNLGFVVLYVIQPGNGTDIFLTLGSS